MGCDRPFDGGVAATPATLEIAERAATGCSYTLERDRGG